MNEKHKKFMNVAFAVAQLSKDPSTKVGALVLGPDGEVRSLGYNGAPRGSKADEDERFTTRPEKYFWVAHAEANAIYNAARVGTPLNGGTMVVTHAPCMECAKAIVQSGIRHVITHMPERAMVERWAQSLLRTGMLFDECGVEVTIL